MQRLKQIGALVAVGVFFTSAGMAFAQSSPVNEQEDKYQWLEDVLGAKSLAWVKAENERTADVLQQDPRFAELQSAALKVREAPGRLPIPNVQNGTVYNTWNDAAHVRGILRRTTLADYMKPQPHWHTVLDYDALAKHDNEKWVHGGVNSLYPGNGLALVGLSAGGEDAVTLREFDLKTEKFVSNGFVLPKSKQTVAWVDKDTLLVARDWGAGTMTASGYPFVVKVWKRGTPLASAKEIYRGVPSDVSVDPATLHDGQGHQISLLSENVDFFTTKVRLWTPSGVKPIGLPGKLQVEGLVDGRLIVTIDEAW